MRSLIWFLLAALLVLPQSVFSQDREQTMIDQRFDVEDGGLLAVNVGDADVTVTPGASGEAHVQVILEGRDMKRAKEYYERQNFSVTQRGNTIHVETDADKGFRISWRDWRDHPHIHVHITVPEAFNADLKTSDGDVSVERLRGEIYVKTSDGDVLAGSLLGSDVTLATSDGDVKADLLDAESISIQTSDGDLDLGEVKATNVSARTSDGDIRISRLEGRAEVKTSDGDLHIAAFSGASLSARTSDGDLVIDELIAETSTVQSSDGDITLRRVEGDLTVTASSGSIRLDLFKPGAVSATSSDGDITMTLPTSLRADVRLRGSDVRVSSSLDFNGRIEDEKADGEINGGGPLIEARTSDGEVTLRGK